MKHLIIVSLIFLCDLHNAFAKNPRDLIPENQKMIYGAALTDSSIVAGWNISDEDLKYALQPFKILRISIGPSDFSPDIYDWETNFDFDKTKKIPYLKRILKLRPDIQIMALPWSAPERFRIPLANNDKKFIASYVKLLSDFVNRYKSSGIQIKYLGIQNEPLYGGGVFLTTMYLSSEIYIKIIKGLKLRLPSVKIIAYDHNPTKEGIAYCETIANSEAADSVYGYSFHDYEGNPRNIESLAKYHKPILHTEITASISERGDWFDKTPADWHSDHMEQYLRVGAKTYFFWNLFLNLNSGPYVEGHHYDAGKPMMWVTGNNKLIPTSEWKLLADKTDSSLYMEESNYVRLRDFKDYYISLGSESIYFSKNFDDSLGFVLIKNPEADGKGFYLKTNSGLYLTVIYNKELTLSENVEDSSLFIFEDAAHGKLYLKSFKSNLYITRDVFGEVNLKKNKDVSAEWNIDI